MDLVIKNGTIVTANESYQADIGVDGETISLIGRDLSGDEVIDATGMLVMPGGIDPHTHMELPFMGTVSADDFQTGTLAAACGGTTTIIDFAIQGAGQTLREALDIWLGRAKDKVCIDYGMHVAIGAMDDERMAEMADMVELGVPSFKIFMAYKGSLMVDDETLFRSLIRAKEIGALISVHAENGDILNYLINKNVAEGQDRSHLARIEPSARSRSGSYPPGRGHGRHDRRTALRCPHDRCRCLGGAQGRTRQGLQGLRRNLPPVSDVHNGEVRGAQLRGCQIRHVASLAGGGQPGSALERDLPAAISKR